MEINLPITSLIFFKKFIYLLTNEQSLHLNLKMKDRTHVQLIINLKSCIYKFII